jgi:hypothetical protein
MVFFDIVPEMNSQQQFLSQLTDEQNKIFLSLETPALIQSFLDSIPYRIEDDNCCALAVFRDGKAHCFDGSLFAAAALRQIGYTPVVVQMLPDNDDDHMMAIYRRNDRYGAVAKSNFAGLRSREPVYATIRELVMAYFNDFYSVDGKFSLRGYTLPLNLSRYDRFDWLCSDTGAQVIYQRLHDIRKFHIMTPAVIAALSPINAISFQSGMSITNLDGVFKPGSSQNKDFGFDPSET